ncbi:hypothetical protein HCH29_08955 [Enterococcus gilvus]|nr:hypothetical protein [Enterococcus gilvus]
MLGGIVLGSMQVFADNSLDTDVRMQFAADGYTPEPNPDPTDLQLRFVPDAFDFGNTLQATGSAVTSAPQAVNKHVTMYDGRIATANNWKMEAKASVLTNSADSSRTINTGNVTVNIGKVMEWTDQNAPNAANVGTTPMANVTNQVVTGMDTNSDMVLPINGSTSVEIARSTSVVPDKGYAVPINTAKLTVTGVLADAGHTYTGAITWTASTLP